ncbi:MAG: hypothetical protein OXF79_22260 [Chloroflexi bacterium]|nr:hypothetical protein [Chloroflexota bacterium]
MNSTTLSRRAVTIRTKRIIAKKKAMPVSEVLLSAYLRNSLRFTDPGVRALSLPLNREFKPVGVLITPAESGACQTVKDVRNLVWKKLPEHRRGE